MLPGWSRTEIAGKPADVFDPPAARRGSRCSSCTRSAGSRRRTTSRTPPRSPATGWASSPRTAAVVVGRPRLPGVRPGLTAERHLLDHVVPWMERAGSCGRGRSRRPGSAWAGRGRSGSGSSTRTGSRSSRAWPGRSTTTSGTAAARRSTRCTTAGSACRQDTAVLHVDPHRVPAARLVRLRPGRRRVVPRQRPAAREALRGRRAAHADLETTARRALVGVLRRDGRADDGVRRGRAGEGVAAAGVGWPTRSASRHGHSRSE